LLSPARPSGSRASSCPSKIWSCATPAAGRFEAFTNEALAEEHVWASAKSMWTGDEDDLPEDIYDAVYEIDVDISLHIEEVTIHSMASKATSLI
jgi:hypothetical protein